MILARFLFFTVLLIITDQLSKYIVRLRQPADGGFYICNPGIAFGIKIPEFLIWAIYAIIIGLVLLKIAHLKIPLCFSLLKKGGNASLKLVLPLWKRIIKRDLKTLNKRPRNSSFTFLKNLKYPIHNTYYLILITAGALSNLIDRLYFGCVIDFIDLKFWPVFNLADVFITIGGIMLIISNIKYQISKT